jgi:hypothetical protein
VKAEKARRVAKRIVASILDEGLAKSTWRDAYFNAHADLCKHYREDLIRDVQTILERVKHDE